MGALQTSSMSWHGNSGLPTTSVVKKVVRLDVPVDKFPNVCIIILHAHLDSSSSSSYGKPCLNLVLQYNFVGRLLGPRGNSLKRVEATTQCRVYIRGRGSVKDSVKVTSSLYLSLSLFHFPSCNWFWTPSAIWVKIIRIISLPGENFLKSRVFFLPVGRVIDRLLCAKSLLTQEEQLREKPGYEHLNEPLHVLVEAEFPAEVIDAQLNQAISILEDLLKPVVWPLVLPLSFAPPLPPSKFLTVDTMVSFCQDESLDYYKKQQLRELALLNGTLREDSPHRSPSASPFSGTGMKRAKTGRWHVLRLSLR